MEIDNKIKNIILYNIILQIIKEGFTGFPENEYPKDISQVILMLLRFADDNGYLKSNEHYLLKAYDILDDLE